MIKVVYLVLLSLALMSCGGGSDNSPVENTTNEIGDDGDPACTGFSLNFSNLGAEEIESDTTEDQFAALTFWKNQIGNTSSTLYGLGGYPEASDTQGDRLFTGGFEELSIAQQTVTVSADVLGCGFTLRAEIGGFDQQEDNAKVDLMFLASTGDVLPTHSLGPVTSVERGNGYIDSP